MRYFYLVVVILILIPHVVDAGLFDILDEKYIEDISELPYSPGIPSINWQQQGHIRAWIDIVGFRNMIKERGEYFIHGDPADMAIVQYGTDHDIKENFDSITSTVSYTQSGNNLTVTLTVVLKWHVWCRTKTSSWICGRPSETKTFSDVEVVPNRADILGNYTLNSIEYNNTIEPKIVIIVTEPNASKIVIQYSDKVVTHTKKAYLVEKTSKGIYFANATMLESWDVRGHDVARFGNSMIINTNLSTFDYSQLNITVSDIFGSVRAEQEQFNITRVTYEPEKVVFNPLLFGFVGVMGTLVCASIYLVMRIQL